MAARLFFSRDQRYRRLMRRERVFRDRNNPLDSLPDEELLAKYRFQRQGILFLCDILEGHLDIGL